MGAPADRSGNRKPGAPAKPGSGRASARAASTSQRSVAELRKVLAQPLKLVAVNLPAGVALAEQIKGAVRAEAGSALADAPREPPEPRDDPDDQERQKPEPDQRVHPHDPDHPARSHHVRHPFRCPASAHGRAPSASAVFEKLT